MPGNRLILNEDNKLGSINTNGIDINANKKVYHYTRHSDDLTSQILEDYRLSTKFLKKQDEKSYVRAFQAFINIAPILRVRWATIEKAYYIKRGENYHRQDTNY